MNPEYNDEDTYEWVPAQEPIPLPEFVEQSAKGEMKMIDGKIHVKAPIENTYHDDYWDHEADEEPMKYEDKHGK